MAASTKSDQRGCAALGGPECACRAAVIRAFTEMTESGAPYDSALSVAYRVFHHHHPDGGSGVRALIERWISRESVH
jgi:hypothetical protein